jgi:hypothetical protein
VSMHMCAFEEPANVGFSELLGVMNLARL